MKVSKTQIRLQEFIQQKSWRNWNLLPDRAEETGAKPECFHSGGCKSVSETIWAGEEGHCEHKQFPLKYYISVLWKKRKLCTGPSQWEL